MATDGIAPNYADLYHENCTHSPIERDHASTHFLCKLPYFLAEDVHAHEQMLILDDDGDYQPHHVIRIKPLGEENHGYLLLPVDKGDRRIKLAFRGTDHFEQQGDKIDSFNAVEKQTLNFVFDAINAHYGIGARGLELTIAGSPNTTASNQCFVRALIKRIANPKQLDNIALLRINNLATLEEGAVSEAACINTLEHPIPNKMLKIETCQFGRIAKHLLQKEAYAHIFHKKPATLQQIEEANKKLHPDILTFASAHLLSSYSYYLASKGLFHDREVLMLKEDGTYKPHHVIQLPLVLGMFGYVLLPLDKNDKSVRITFRGTDFADTDSALINLETEGPSSTSFPSVKDDVMACIKSAVQKHYGKGAKNLKFVVSGHSQGASTSQLFASAFLDERANCNDFDNVAHLSLTTFNDPGVSTEARIKADNLVYEQHRLGKPIRIESNFGRVDGDIVQILGEDMIFVRLPYPLVETTLLKVDKELAYRRYKYGELTEALGNAHYLNTFFSMLDPDGSVSPAKIQIEHNNRTYTNQTEAEHRFIKEEMLYKIQRSVSCKKELHRLVDRLPLSDIKEYIDNSPLTLQDYLHLGIEPLEYLAEIGLSNCYIAGYIGYLCYETYKMTSDIYGSTTLSQPRTLLTQFKNSIVDWYKGKSQEVDTSFNVNRNGILQEAQCDGASSSSSVCKRD